MARILRSQGIYYLGKPQVVRVPSVEQQEQTIRTVLAVQARGGPQRRYIERKFLSRQVLTAAQPPFTTFPLLDDFNRPDGFLVDPPWTMPVWGIGTAQIISNRVGSTAACAAMWDTFTFSNGAVAIDVPVLPTAGNNINVWIRMDGGSATTPSGYRLRIIPSTGEWTFRRHDASTTPTQIAIFTQAFNAGDSFGAVAYGPRLYAFYKPSGGVWRLVGSVFDATYSSGFIGFSTGDATSRIDNFSGGPLPNDVVPQLYNWIGPFPPMVINGLPTPDQTTVRSELAGRDHDRTRRATHSKLRPPTVVTPAAAFVAGPIQVRLTRARPRHTTAQIRPPTVLQVFAGPASRLVKTRPRATLWDLRPPQVVRVPSVEQRQQTIIVRLVRGRAGKTEYRLFPPTVVRVPAVQQQQQTIRVRLVRGRRPGTRSLLFPPTVVTTPVVQVFYAGHPVLVHTRPQPTTYTLGPPTTLQIFTGPRSELTKTRPRATVYRLRGPQVVRVPSVEQQQQTIRVRLVQARPRHTLWAIRPPVVIRIPAVEQQLRTLRVELVRGRAGRTRTDLFPPAVIAAAVQPFVAYAIRVELVHSRPRHTVWTLRPAQVVRVPAVEQQLRTLRTRLVRTRPRPTTRVLRPPVVVRIPSVEQQQRTIRDWLVRARPRHTVTVLRPPAVVRTIGPPARKALVQTRPRPTTRVLRPPTVLRVFETGAAVLTRIRPRHTIWQLRPPTAVQPFVAAVETTLHRWLTRIRPPQTRPHKPQPPFTPTVPGKGCLTDQAAFEGCLTDGLAAVGCLTNQPGTAGCLTDQAGTEGCLVDLSAATATLRDEN